MAKKGDTVVIKKVKKGGGHGAHGGAWKVAYADFVTAMMAFFLVMWLMGSDEETKAAVAQYFNNPPSIFSAGNDAETKAVMPMGEFSGDGQSLLYGKEGQFPDELVQNPVRPIVQQRLSEHQELAELIKEVMDGNTYAMKIDMESIHFSIPTSLIFEPLSDRLTDKGKEYLDKLGRLVRGYRGYMAIEGHLDESTLAKLKTNAYEFTVSQSVAVMDYFTKRQFMSEDRIVPRGAGTRRKLASIPDQKRLDRDNRIEFTLSKNPID
jgi:chemotaxis protein MotB